MLSIHPHCWLNAVQLTGLASDNTLSFMGHSSSEQDLLIVLRKSSEWNSRMPAHPVYITSNPQSLWRSAKHQKLHIPVMTPTIVFNFKTALNDSVYLIQSRTCTKTSCKVQDAMIQDFWVLGSHGELLCFLLLIAPLAVICTNITSGCVTIEKAVGRFPCFHSFTTLHLSNKQRKSIFLPLSYSNLECTISFFVFFLSLNKL